ncbi:MAG: glycerophosphodiester phosphodiesterase [Phycisphaerales bacterium]|nr:MAG: glycerophosphodiester phosphodiesterase [Phycisphaerales bacterium]
MTPAPLYGYKSSARRDPPPWKLNMHNCDQARAAAGLLTDVARSLRRSLPQLLACDLLFKIFALAVLGPLTAWMFTILLLAGGSRSVTNEQILSFLLSLPGLLFLVLWGVTTLATLFAEQAGLLAVTAAHDAGRRLSALAALWLMIRKLPALLDLGLRQAVVYLLALAPFVALAGLTYTWLTAEQDINYLLAAKPPRFLIAVGIGAILALGAIASFSWLFLRWAFALPVCLFEATRGTAALRRSATLMRGARQRLAGLLLGWLAIWAVVSAAAGLLFDLISELVLAPLGERLALVIPVVAALLLVNTLVFLVLSFAGFAGFCLLLARLYDVCRAREGLPPCSADVSRLGAVTDDGRAPAWARRALRFIPALILVAVAVISYAIVRQLDLKDHVAVTAHRGSSLRAPENTLSAVRQAIADGADFAEIDVQETADGQVVVFHDEDLKRIAGVDRKICEITYPELCELDVGTWFSPQFAGERVPTLAEVIEEARGYIRLNIELKLSGHERHLVLSVVQTVREQDFAAQCIISSLSYDAIREVKRLDDRLTIGYIVYGTVGDLSSLDVDFFSVADKLASRHLVRGARKRGKDVHVWTVNDPSRMAHFIDLGATNIITDDPLALITLLRERAALTHAERVLLVFRNWLRS